MNTSDLLQRLAFASFAERESLAEAVAGKLDEGERKALVRALGHENRNVRLGVIEILARTGDAAMIAPLLAHARARQGDDRVFALRGLCRLAQPGDRALQAVALEFAASPDPFTQAQAQALLRALHVPGPPAEKAIVASTRVAPTVDAAMLVGNLQATLAEIRAQSIERVLAMGEEGDALLLRALLEGSTDGPRIDLVLALERLPQPRFVMMAGEALLRGNSDVVALVARALLRQADNLPGEARSGLRPLLERARRRLASSPLASAALDDALLQVAEADLPPDLWEQLLDADDERLSSQVDRWLRLPAAELASRAPVLIAVANKHADRWAIVGAALELAAPALRPSVRAELRTACQQAVRVLPADAARDRVAAIVQVFAQVAEPGEPLPVPLFTAAERFGDGEILCDLVGLCLRLASEEAALRLLDLAKDPLPEVAAAAQAAVPKFDSRWVRIATDEQGSRVIPDYRAAQGKALLPTDKILVDPDTRDSYALDGGGNPVPVKEMAYGACLCCPRARALIRQGREGLYCPSTRLPYLHDRGHAVRAADHPLGRCTRCESISARVREGAHVVCPDCGAGRPATSMVPAGDPGFPGECSPSPVEKRTELPRPPSRDELRLMEPHLRHAMAANIFVVADALGGGWSGSGLIVARQDRDVAILTNRHMVEDRRAHEVPNLRALSLSSEVVPLTLVWRAQGGVDLALLQAHFEEPDALEVIELGDGSCMVGSPLFSIGNPLDLAWTYTSGTLSAIRHWETPEKVAVRLLQSDLRIGPGSSGGGMFHQQGHLVGITSFGRQGDHGDAAHFAISVPTIRETIERERVLWRGRLLEELLR
jgi:hypothetical protein